MDKIAQWLTDHPLNWEYISGGFAGSLVAVVFGQGGFLQRMSIFLVGILTATYLGRPFALFIKWENEPGAAFVVGMVGYGLANFLINLAKDPLTAWIAIRNAKNNTTPPANP